MTVTPHDALFKAAFSHPGRAAEELRHVLGPEVAALIDFSSLSLETGSFVDEALRDRHADLLFATTLAGREIRIYVLFEHQSTVDPWMPLRLLAYMLRVWEEYRAAHPTARRLPMILPVVLHHSETGWRAARDFEALVDLPEDVPESVRAYCPRFRFALDDLGAETDESLRRRPASASTRMVLSALQHVRLVRDIGRLLRDLLALARDARSEPDGRRASRLVLRYLHEVRGIDERAIIDIIAAEAGPTEQENMQTIADALREEGMQQGMQQGQKKILMQLLTLRFGPLPAAAVVRIQAADEPRIERWTNSLLTAATLDELLAIR